MNIAISYHCCFYTTTCLSSLYPCIVCRPMSTAFFSLQH